MTSFFSIRSASRARFLSAAAVAVGLTAGAAPAQYLAPDVHGYGAQQIRNNYRSGQGTTRFQAPAIRSAPAAGPAYYSAAPAYQPAVVTPFAPPAGPTYYSAMPAPVVTTVPAPVVAAAPVVTVPQVAAAPATAYIGIRGPDGVVRQYPVEGGANALTGVIVVDQGQPGVARVVAQPIR